MPSSSSHLKRLNMFSMNNKLIGWLRHVMTAISIIVFDVGCILLSPIFTVIRSNICLSVYLSIYLIFTYSVLGVGFLLFLSGLIGWVAGASEALCVLRLYLVLLILVIASEIGGIIALNILQMRLDDILLNGWAEVNQGTRNIIQDSFGCCGFYGPKEFAYTNYPLSNSCYDTIQDVDSSAEAQQQLKQQGCGAPLKFWMNENKAIWCSILAAVGGLQLMCVVLCIHIIHKLKDKVGYKRTSSSKRRLHNEKGGYSL
ncbi:23 kDa integral membrane protein-like [Palaemon carinicauda]|uniref:23 kDa integral membrane protein-like n=1 Tax=Palaemon carinicauda TaxID=392227 RepID=UPI0035B688AB